MRRAYTLNRYLAIALLLTLTLTLTAAVFAWLSALEQRGTILRESRFEFSLNNVKSSLELGLELGLPLHDLPGAQELIERNRMQEPVILSIDIFDANGHIVFTTETAGVGANLPQAWMAPCLSRERSNWSSQDDAGNVLCGSVMNGYDQVAGGVVLRYRLPNRASAFGVLGRYWAPALSALLVLAGLGSLAGWLVLRHTERLLDRQTEAITGHGAALDIDTLAGPLAAGLTTLERLEHELAATDRETDRLDNLS